MQSILAVLAALLAAALPLMECVLSIVCLGPLAYR